MRVLSLFSGGGLGDYGLELAGMEIVGQVEIDDYCQKILSLRWPNVPKWKDIREIRGNEVIEKCGTVDLVSGGFPCQPFSVAGKQRGAADDRNLWPEMFRVIKEITPTFCLIENVPGVIGYFKSAVIPDLENTGYDFPRDIQGRPIIFDIPAVAFGANHIRHRFWLIAYSGSAQSRRVSNIKREKVFTSRGSCAPLANATSGRSQRSQSGDIEINRKAQEKRSPQTNRIERRRETLAYTARPNGKRLGTEPRKEQSGFTDSSWWAVEPNVGRVAHGIATEFHASIRRLGYENSNSQEAVTKIDELRGGILQRMWSERESPKTSLRASARYLRYLVSIVSQERAHEEWNMGSWIATRNDLRDLWESIHAEALEKTKDLQSKLLEGIRQAECSKKMGKNRVDRLKLLGNGQVVQVVEWIGKRILEFDEV